MSKKKQYSLKVWQSEPVYHRDRDPDGILRCFYCGDQVFNGSGYGTFNRKIRTLDHIIGRYVFLEQGKKVDHNPNNLITSCMHCNSQRGKMDIFDWLDYKGIPYSELEEQINQPIDHSIKAILTRAMKHGSNFARQRYLDHYIAVNGIIPQY